MTELEEAKDQLEKAEDRVAVWDNIRLLAKGACFNQIVTVFIILWLLYLTWCKT